ncbi:MAG: sensor histidine kinase [Mucilaginibacter sp.]
MAKISLKPWLYNFVPLLVWALLLMLPFVSASPNPTGPDHRQFLMHILVDNLVLLVVFYLHTYLLYPLIKQKALGLYLFSLLVLLGLYWLYDFFFKLPPPQNFPGSPVFNHGKLNSAYPPMVRPGNFVHLLGPAIAILCSFCFRVITDNWVREQLIKERETIHLRTELNFLRSQVNPHFLFNTLNNLTSLARKKSDLLEPAIINLSQLMRYMLYESAGNKVTLKKEIEYLQGYINLQLLRFGDEVTVKTKLSGNFEDWEIDPMLLIPLVENAFKYGTGLENNNLILINLEVSPNNQNLHFKVVNYFLSADNNNHESTGIGLKNIRRRLHLLYPGKHYFSAHRAGDMFTSEMTISIS